MENNNKETVYSVQMYLFYKIFDTILAMELTSKWASCTTFYLFISYRHLGCFHFGVLKIFWWILMYKFQCEHVFNSSGYIPRNLIIQSHCNSLCLTCKALPSYSVILFPQFHCSTSCQGHQWLPCYSILYP